MFSQRPRLDDLSNYSVFFGHCDRSFLENRLLFVARKRIAGVCSVRCVSTDWQIAENA